MAHEQTADTSGFCADGREGECEAPDASGTDCEGEESCGGTVAERESEEGVVILQYLGYAYLFLFVWFILLHPIYLIVTGEEKL